MNHSNIAIIHGLEKSQGTYALVMELAEGEDLSQRISRGLIPVEDALPIARQIAEALEAAHEQGTFPDGQRFILNAETSDAPQSRIRVITNWTPSLK